MFVCQHMYAVLLTGKVFFRHNYPAKSRGIFNNYSPKWGWLVVDIYRAAKRRGKYLPLATDTEVNSLFILFIKVSQTTNIYN